MTKDQPNMPAAKRVFLRYPVEGDFEELAELYRRSRKHLTGFAAANFTRDRFDQIIESNKLEANEYFLVCRKQDNAIIGTLAFSQIFRRGFQNAYLGYQLFAGFTGFGYMTEAVAVALKFFFNDLKLHRVEANVQPNNVRSIAVLERNGFVKEGFSEKYLKIGGRWCDHERWAIVRENWKSKRI